jgi:hypothetical protein
MKTVTVEGVGMSVEAARSAEAVGCSPREDVEALRSGRITAEQLLAECLEGADDESAWREYVAAIELAASATTTCAACGATFPMGPEGADCATCGAGPICEECWKRAGMKCGSACEAASK